MIAIETTGNKKESEDSSHSTQIAKESFEKHLNILHPGLHRLVDLYCCIFRVITFH